MAFRLPSAFWLLTLAFTLSSCVLKQEHDALLKSSEENQKGLFQLERENDTLKSENRDLKKDNDELNLRNQDLSNTNQLLVEKNRACVESCVKSRKQELIEQQNYARSELRQQKIKQLKLLIEPALVKGTELAVAESHLRLSLANTLLFEDTHTLSTDGRQFLNALAQIFSREKPPLIEIEGHADSSNLGKEATKRYGSNWGLAAIRASSILEFLNQNGVATQTLKLISYGPSQPIANNNSSSGRKKNRRVVLNIYPDKDM